MRYAVLPRFAAGVRHGPVLGVCAVLVAVAVGFGTAAFSEGARTPTTGEGITAPGRSSLDVIRSLFFEEEPARTSTTSSGTEDDAGPTAAAASSLRRLTASTTASRSLREDRAEHATATPLLVAGDRVVATVSFYYCAGSAGPDPVGDGGNFCGVMRDGTAVYPGAAACDVAYLGQQFRIEGDPTERLYTCNDTGSAVHGLHRDIWFFSSAEGWQWQLSVGPRAVLEIVR